MFTKESLAYDFGFPFSKQAVDVLNRAEGEARGLYHNYIGTEHILLGLASKKCPILEELGVKLPKLRTTVEFIVGRSREGIYADVIGLTPQAKKVIELSIDEARGRQRVLYSYHILLGLVKEGKGIAAGVLESLGVSLDRVRYKTQAAFLGVSTSQALITLEALEVFLFDPVQDVATKKQIGKILDGTLGLISP